MTITPPPTISGWLRSDIGSLEDWALAAQASLRAEAAKLRKVTIAVQQDSGLAHVARSGDPLLIYAPLAPAPLAPMHWRDGLATLVHTNMGHLGPRKVAAELRRSLWWPSMEKSIKNSLETCEHCQLSKARRRAAHGQYTAGS